MLALDTVAATTLAARFSDTSEYTVEATIKSILGLGAETLRDVVAAGGTTETRRKAVYVAKIALLIIEERTMAHIEALAVEHAGTTQCDSCPGDGIYRWAGCFENGVWKGKQGPCYRCNGTGRQTAKDERRNRYYDNHVRRVYA